ncbi:outer membrane beta-barrel protein [Terriglobus aquaticus]|uniref:Carboxypeptidase regulatory-like domain-containing protein n=1 Tax=Terriglobus aquaticus TaxID=940139 RepID=A0ABW9KN35_9BACT|nr:carboxypeptidase regulatory-like domain-containing protein [Terriglobus aquaticus]
MPHFRSIVFAATMSLPLFLSSASINPLLAQETTGSLQGTVRDPSGAVVAHATVTVTTPTLVGSKSDTTDSKGNYHFANLPPGSYTITVDAQGFTQLKQTGLMIEVGRSPSVDLKLGIGSENTTVEVTTESPQIDTTSVTTQTVVGADVIQYVPRGTTFQSVIQFAPAARNEPLMGNTTTNGSGSVSPGNGSNGSPYGYSIAGGSDSENSYLVEGQETANLIGGYSHTNVPFDFIQEVQVKTSGIASEYGGAMGGVVNVIMKKGSAQFHGSAFIQYNSSGLNGSPNPSPRYNPLDSGTTTNWLGSSAGYQGFIDPAYQSNTPVKPKTSLVFPGFTLGGPLVPFSSTLKDKLFFFVGFNPQLSRYAIQVNYGPSNGGLVPFSQNQNTYYTIARVDAQATKRIRVFGSWLYQLQRENGENLPSLDSKQGYFNAATGCFGAATSASNPCLSTGIPQFANAHTLGYVAPNITVNTGADITVTNNIVATSHFGYYFENYHDFGFPTTGVLNYFNTNGLGTTDATGAPLPAAYQQSTGYYNAALDQNYTQYNASKAIQFDQDVAWFKSGWGGSHNFKFGYQLTRNSNTLNQHYNEPLVNLYVGNSSAAQYSPSSSTGNANCAAYVALYGACQGRYGYVSIEDFGTHGSATSYNHGLYAQDSWTIARRLTLDYGVRFDKEYLPGEAQNATSITGANLSKPINFSWTDKFAPRIGASWDVAGDGKTKIFGDYGKFYDTMKLNLAISSFGGQYWQNCYFALDTPNLGSINPVFNSASRYCSGAAPNSTTNFAGGATPAGLTFLESQDFRSFPTTCSTCSAVQEGVAPGLKPYQQHEAVVGVDRQLTRTLALEVRYDRRRLDQAIEDASLASSVTGSETFVVVNPGRGVNASYTGFCQFLYGAGAADCTSSSGQYPPDQQIPAARSYDGVEFRLQKAVSNHWSGMLSYTYSYFRGNYTGLTSSDLADGGSGGRNAPNNSRSFDEPYFQYNANGGSSSGRLPTDRPNTFKGYAYYTLGYLRRFNSDFGIFQTIYQGSPNTTYTNVGYSENAFPVDVFNRGKWADVTQDPSTGIITVGTPRTFRNPWYNQTDFDFTESFKIDDRQSLRFATTFTNLLNDHAVTAVYEQLDSAYSANQYITPGGYAFYDGAAFYAAAEHPYDVAKSLNGSTATSNNLGGPETINSQYGKPLYYQQPRNIRFQLSYTF